jgi:predicted DNA binding CopG/RHH family protein
MDPKYKQTDFGYELDDYEAEIEEALDKGEFKRAPDFEAQKIKLMAAARATMEKVKNINIRISQGDLFEIQNKARKQGIPYQTLISSLIHQYSNNQIDYNVLREPRAPYPISKPKPKPKKKSGS